MSELFPLFDTDGEDDSPDPQGDDSADRRRSLWTLAGVLAFAAVVTVVAILAVGSPGRTRAPNITNLAAPTEVITADTPTPTAAQLPASPVGASSSAPSHSPTPTRRASASHAASSSAKPQPSPSMHPTPTPSSSTPAPQAGPCPTSAPCPVPGGLFGAAAEASRYRSRLGGRPGKFRAVQAELTPEAKNCALAAAEGSSCTVPSPLATAILPAQDPIAAVDLVTSTPGNIFADAAMTSFEVGWAYDPPSERYFCVFIEN